MTIDRVDEDLIEKIYSAVTTVCDAFLLPDTELSRLHVLGALLEASAKYHRDDQPNLSDEAANESVDEWCKGLRTAIARTEA